MIVKKQCATCGLPKRATGHYFLRRHDRLAPDCKECERQIALERARSPRQLGGSVIAPKRTAKVLAPQTPLWMRAEEAAQILGVSRWTLYRAAKAGTLEGIRHRRVGNCLLLSYADVMAPATKP